jgi:hypothetical protein
MDRNDLIVIIVGVALLALFAIAVIWFANNSTKRVANRRFAGRYDGPTNQAGCAQTQISDCPPQPGPGCVPAKLIQSCDQYVAVRVPASACGCSGGASFHEDLQMMADIMAQQQAADRRAAFFAAQERMLAKQKPA